MDLFQTSLSLENLKPLKNSFPIFNHFGCSRSHLGFNIHLQSFQFTVTLTLQEKLHICFNARIPIQIKVHFDILLKFLYFLHCQTLEHHVWLVDFNIEITRRIKLLDKNINRLDSALLNPNLRPGFALVKVEFLLFFLPILKLSPSSLSGKHCHFFLTLGLFNCSLFSPFLHLLNFCYSLFLSFLLGFEREGLEWNTPRYITVDFLLPDKLLV
nr:hypothetical protein Iba_chr15aCG5490 [Ipomoea batatas]